MRLITCNTPSHLSEHHNTILPAADVRSAAHYPGMSATLFHCWDLWARRRSCQSFQNSRTTFLKKTRKEDLWPFRNRIKQDLLTMEWRSKGLKRTTWHGQLRLDSALPYCFRGACVKRRIRKVRFLWNGMRCTGLNLSLCSFKTDLMYKWSECRTCFIKMCALETALEQSGSLLTVPLKTICKTLQGFPKAS